MVPERKLDAKANRANNFKSYSFAASSLQKNCKTKVVEIPCFRQHCKPNQQLCCSVNAYQSTPDIPDIQDIQVPLMMTMLVKDEC